MAKESCGLNGHTVTRCPFTERHGGRHPSDSLWHRGHAYGFVGSDTRLWDISCSKRPALPMRGTAGTSGPADRYPAPCTHDFLIQLMENFRALWLTTSPPLSPLGRPAGRQCRIAG